MTERRPAGGAVGAGSAEPGESASARDGREAAASLPSDLRLVVLVGFMGSGKSTVGALLAERIGWDFVDLDREIERDRGASIPEIFRREGEPSFRALEARAAEAALARERTVLATGGGWAAAPDRLASLPEGAIAVWLRVAPETAVERARRHAGDRPLLDVPDPLGRARELIRRRESHYARASLVVDTDDLKPADVAGRILAALRARTDEGQEAGRGGA